MNFNSQKTSYSVPEIFHPVFQENLSWWNALSPLLRKKNFGRDDHVLSHGDEASHLWLVYKGWVTLSRQTPDGRESIVGLCTQGDIFGEAALFANADYPYTVKVVGMEAELASIPAISIRKAIAGDASLSANIMAMLNSRMTQAQLKLEHMSTMSAAQRLGCFFLRMCHSRSEGATALHIPIEKNILATYLGMKPETLSRSQQQLKPLGISVHGAEIHIGDIGRLRELVCGSCSEFGNCSA